MGKRFQQLYEFFAGSEKDRRILRVLERIEKAGLKHELEYIEEGPNQRYPARCVRCDVGFSRLYNLQQKAEETRIKSLEAIEMGVFCPHCGQSMQDDRNLFDVLLAWEERHLPQFADEGILENARHRILMLAEEVAKKREELEQARAYLRQLQNHYRISEPGSYRKLPPSSQSTAS